MECPRCRGSALQERRVPRTEEKVDVCRICKGVWFDRGELERIIKTAAKELHVSFDAEEVDRLCPRCEVAMWSFDYPQTLVTVDMCRRCGGLWLDAGEAKEIQAVRESLRKSGEIEESAPVPGFKGTLLRLLDRALEAVKT